MRRFLALAGLLAASAVPAARGEEPRRGPLEAREGWLPAQPRLSLPAATPDLLPPGRSRLALQLDWGNDFGWQQDGPGERPRDRSFLVDGEHRSLALDWRRGLSPRVELDARLPLQWRGGGELDGVIDWFHGFTRRLGLPQNGRPSFERDRLRVLGRSPAGAPLAWTGAGGTGLGRLEVGSRLALAAPREERTPLALALRLTLPTGTGPFAMPGLEAGAQLLAARRLGRSWDLYAGLGATVHGCEEWQGLRYETLRAHGFLALEWRPARRLSLLLQVDGAGPLLEGVADYPELHAYLRLLARLDLGGATRLDLGFAENVKNQQSTTDFALLVGVGRRF